MIASLGENRVSLVLAPVKLFRLKDKSRHLWYKVNIASELMETMQ